MCICNKPSCCSVSYVLTLFALKCPQRGGMAAWGFGDEIEKNLEEKKINFIRDYWRREKFTTSK